MSSPVRGATRAEVVSTLAVVVLTALAVVALWPRGPARPEAAPAPGPPAAVAVSDAELAPLRAAADLLPCPDGSGTTTDGPLAGVTVPCLGGPGEVDLGAALAGRPVLLNVWASWCAPCREELPALEEYRARPDAVEVVGLNVRDDPRAALRLLTELGVRFPSVVGDAAAPALALPPALPISYLVRADGSVARVDPPVPFRTADDVAAAVARLRTP